MHNEKMSEGYLSLVETSTVMYIVYASILAHIDHNKYYSQNQL